jgi:MFS family permease
MLNLGLTGFVLASLACGLATSIVLLVVARILQGMSAALMSPQVQSIVQRLYAPRERVSVLGVFAVLGGLAAVTGPLVGGLLIDWDLFGLGWRMIFLVNLPFGVLLLLASRRFLPPWRSPGTPRLDLVGALLVTGLFVSLLVPLVEGRARDWPAWCGILLATAPVWALSTVWHSRHRMRRVGSAMLVTALFRDRAFSTGLLLAGLFQASMAGFLFMLTLALQDGLGLSPAQVGLLHAPYAIGVAAGVGVLARKILPRLGPLNTVIGALSLGAGFVLVAWQVRSGVPELATFVPTLAFAGLGCGMILGSVAPITLSEIDREFAGAASGTLRSLQECGGAAGVAVFGGIYLSMGQAGLPTSWLAAFAWSSGLLVVCMALIAALAVTIPRNLRVFARD